MKPKMSCPLAIKHLLIFLSRQFPQHPVRVLRANMGTELLTFEVIQHCEQNGIKTEFSSPYVPEENGLAERSNRRII